MNRVVQVLRHGQVDYLHLWCPGCDERHQVITSRPDSGIRWDWNGSLEAPTISPSMLITGGSENITCHSFVRNGQWQFLDDCTHNLAGQTVPMVPVDQWPA